SLNCLFAALTCVTIFEIAQRCFSRQVAVWSGWAWAANPLFMEWPVKWVWDTSLSALLFSVIFLAALELAEREDLKSWTGFGALWGFSALTNPSLLAFLPFSLAWPAYHLRKASRSYTRSVTVAVIVC